VIIGHEFSHGLTCKRFGGKVHEIGLLLIYLQPAMYCNISDAWLFPEKSKRLLVTFAGAWFDLLVWGLATLLWRITDPSTLPNYLALVVATTLGIKSLFNLNPLIKLDGYYLLSDFVEIPNLRRKAFTHIGGSLRRLWNPSQHTLDSGTRREHRIYWLYGASAAVYSAWLIGFLLASLGSFMMARYHGWGFVFFALLVGAIFRNSVQRSWHFLTSLFALQQGIIRMLKRLAKIIVVLSIVSASLYFIRTDLRVSGEFAILPLHNADVRPDVEGIIEEIVHDEGETVEKGELLVRLSDRDYKAELEKVSAEIAERAARLKLLRAGPRSEEIELAQASVTKGEERLKFAQEYLSMEKTLFEEKLSSRKDLQLAKESAALRQKEIEESQGNLKLLLAGSRPELIEATEAEITRLEAQHKYLEDQLQRLRVLSPITGIITTHRLKEKLGATVKKGDLIAQVQEVNTVTAEISIPENEIADVQLGQSVLLKTRARVRDSFHGTLVSISPVASKPADGLAQRNFLVVTQLDNSARLLKPEMSGNAKIYCGERRLYEIVFRRLVRYIRVEFWSWW
jgi:multidrug resistance efflux pump